ncbi:hypothetical protein PT974_05285 [Cladobotryum mycophilum]|uniref:Uncharacterized protein n=1 Tax=Cladobotryum mycophilum TaxID=491253 RepID=A0ABR0SIC0_9HYPO
MVDNTWLRGTTHLTEPSPDFQDAIPTPGTVVTVHTDAIQPPPTSAAMPSSTPMKEWEAWNEMVRTDGLSMLFSSGML